MEIESIFRPRNVSPVQANNVVILVFNPDLTLEESRPRVLLRGHFEYERPNFTKKFAMNVVEIVVIAIEVLAINEDHP